MQRSTLQARHAQTRAPMKVEAERKKAEGWMTIMNDKCIPHESVNHEGCDWE